SEDVLDASDTFFDPDRAPDRFVMMLASWLDLDRYFEWTGGRPGLGVARYTPGLAHLRVLCASAAGILRGPRASPALARFLMVATGIPGFGIDENPPDENGLARAFHIHVKAPAAAKRLAELVRRIIDQERPAYVTYDIEFAADGSSPPA